MKVLITIAMALVLAGPASAQVLEVSTWPHPAVVKEDDNAPSITPEAGIETASVEEAVGEVASTITSRPAVPEVTAVATRPGVPEYSTVVAPRPSIPCVPAIGCGIKLTVTPAYTNQGCSVTLSVASASSTPLAEGTLVTFQVQVLDVFPQVPPSQFATVPVVLGVATQQFKSNAAVMLMFRATAAGFTSNEVPVLWQSAVYGTPCP